MILGQFHQNLPLGIIRPTMVTNTYKEPFSGWIEGASIASFQAYMDIRYILPLKVLWLANLVLCQYYRGIYINHNRKVRVVMRLVDLYKPYVFFEKHSK
ncbi:putative fatty acyl-coa reductase 4 [Quercus suber]|uniref:Fatty acyl-coa reductase 4 n=1 Tax=Quercus suber TaxID=58331 RepID=A0AAW0IKX4_QUESU